MWNNAIEFQIVYVSALLKRNKWRNISLCNYILMKSSTQIFIFNNPENVMREYHIQNGSCCQQVGLFG